jgi:hypothetical protein
MVVRTFFGKDKSKGPLRRIWIYVIELNHPQYYINDCSSHVGYEKCDIKVLVVELDYLPDS